MESLLELLFGCSVYGYPWEKKELRDKLSECDPCLVIISPPLSCSAHEELDQEKDVWDTMREIFKTIPVLWLAPDSNDLPQFLPAEVEIIATTPVNAVKEVVNKISEITGIEPLIDLKLK